MRRGEPSSPPPAPSCWGCSWVPRRWADEPRPPHRPATRSPASASPPTRAPSTGPPSPPAARSSPTSAQRAASMPIPASRPTTNRPRPTGIYADNHNQQYVSGGREQADDLIDAAGYVPDGRTLPPMLDIEWPRTNWLGLDACYNMTPAQLVIGSGTSSPRSRPHRPARRRLHQPQLVESLHRQQSPFGAYPLFNSGYVANPRAAAGRMDNVDAMAVRNSGALPGDQDVFNGDYAALARLAGGTRSPCWPRPTAGT